MRYVRIVLLVLVVAECCIQAVLSYWWYEYKCGAYYNLVIKGGALYTTPSRRCSISYYHYITILFTYKACIEKV